jgi:hypothetical protein
MRALAACVASSGLMVGLSAAPASAGAWGYYWITSANSGQCLEIGGWNGSDGAGADQWPCLRDGNGNPDANQLWKTVEVNGYTQLVNVNSGKCLEIGGWSQADGARADQWDCLLDGNGNPDRNQAWHIAANGEIVNLNSGKCLEIGGWSQNWGAGADQWDCLLDGNFNADANQRWSLSMQM